MHKDSWQNEIKPTLSIPTDCERRFALKGSKDNIFYAEVHEIFPCTMDQFVSITVEEGQGGYGDVVVLDQLIWE